MNGDFKARLTVVCGYGSVAVTCVEGLEVAYDAELEDWVDSLRWDMRQSTCGAHYGITKALEGERVGSTHTLEVTYDVDNWSGRDPWSFSVREVAGIISDTAGYYRTAHFKPYTGNLLEWTETKHPPMSEPITGGDLMTREEFLEGVKCDALTDDDGHGCPSDGEKYNSREYVPVWDADGWPYDDTVTHVVWFNR